MGLTEVAGYFGGLARGFETLGIETTFVDLYAHPFAYARSSHRVDGLVRLYQLFSRRRAEARDNGRLSTLWWAPLQKVCVLGILLKAIVSCDAFIFSSDTTFFRYFDLPMLRLLHKRVIFVFTGSDHRPSYLNGGWDEGLDRRAVVRRAEAARQTGAKLRTIEQWADVIVGHHLSSHFHQRRIVPFLLVGFPVALDPPRSPERGSTSPDATRVLHAPSKSKQRSSAEIRRAIDALRARGHEIELIELANVPNQTVLDELARCDFVVDELYSDTRMAGLATEAACLGKPAVVGGYARDEDLAIDGVYPAADFPPVQFCHPDGLEAAIEQLITDVPYRHALGQRARDFVIANWAPVNVARRYVALIEKRVPDGWLFDPRGIRYFAGTGMSESEARTGIHRIVEELGREALCLGDKPEMERAALAFAAAEGS